MDDIKAFLQAVSRPEGATLSEYYRFAGRGAEDELEILFELCEQKGWTPPEEHNECLAYIHNREANPEDMPSFYFLWLRYKLALSPDLDIYIHEVKRYNNNNFAYELIKARLNDVNVTFFRTIDPEKIPEFGLIDISEINGVHVSKIFKEDLKNGTIASLVEE